mmetsp:Transcript_9278/g.16877  ORF Transcript_9278/g.16877 Transcript_9278/m.16877 type:complete len:449 (-) Transcript_9278:53-1399(-)
MLRLHSCHSCCQRGKTTSCLSTCQRARLHFGQHGRQGRKKLGSLSAWCCAGSRPSFLQGLDEQLTSPAAAHFQEARQIQQHLTVLFVRPTWVKEPEHGKAFDQHQLCGREHWQLASVKVKSESLLQFLGVLTLLGRQALWVLGELATQGPDKISQAPLSLDGKALHVLRLLVCSAHEWAAHEAWALADAFQAHALHHHRRRSSLEAGRWHHPLSHVIKRWHREAWGAEGRWAKARRRETWGAEGWHWPLAWHAFAHHSWMHALSIHAWWHHAMVHVWREWEWHARHAWGRHSVHSRHHARRHHTRRHHSWMHHAWRHHPWRKLRLLVAIRVRAAVSSPPLLLTRASSSPLLLVFLVLLLLLPCLLFLLPALLSLPLVAVLVAAGSFRPGTSLEIGQFLADVLVRLPGSLSEALPLHEVQVPTICGLEVKEVLNLEDLLFFCHGSSSSW